MDDLYTCDKSFFPDNLSTEKTTDLQLILG